MIVAIDGPAGAGKSTVAKALAARLGIGYLNTGSMYRAIAVMAARAGVAAEDGDALARIATTHRIALVPDGDVQRVLVDGEDITEVTRSRQVTQQVSAVAAHRDVRHGIVALQREAMRTGDWVADGRDIGSVVCPDADVKVFLTASPEERARRRHAELVAGGEDVALGDVLQGITDRDIADSTRDESPLVVADGAVVVDTTDLALDDVIDRLVALVGERVA